MRERKKHKINSVRSERIDKLIQFYGHKRADTIVKESEYKKKMCKDCKYNSGKCEKELLPSECAKKGEKYKWTE